MSDGQQRRSARLDIRFSDHQLTAQCIIFTGEGESWWQSQPVNLQVDLSSLEGKISQLRDVLTPAQTDLWANLEDPLTEPAPGFVAEQFADCVERVVSAGSRLYAELSELGLKTILNKIDSTLLEGDRLTVVTDCAFLPLEILYPYSFDRGMSPNQRAKNPLRPKNLWGYKYKTEYILFPLPDEPDGWAPPIDEHEHGPDYISFNLNKEIEKAFEQLPFKPIEFHKKFFDSCIGDEKGKWLEEGDSIQDFLLANDNGATIIYLFCHGDSGSPLTNKEDEMLDFGDNKIITPNTLNPQNTYLRGPIVILNSCLSAAVSPLSFSSFHKKFRKKRAMGVIGTTIKMPATFAAAFGRKLIECYMKGIPIGNTIYQLRRELLERDNPLGLFYSLQCPSQIVAPQGGNN